jgi:hypothetical protein
MPKKREVDEHGKAVTDAFFKRVERAIVPSSGLGEHFNSVLSKHHPDGFGDFDSFDYPNDGG